MTRYITVRTVSLEQRMADCIGSGQPFTADDVTGGGAITVAGDHAPNQKQNAIGSMFRKHSVAGHIVPTGRVVNSGARHRKGGMIREWVATELGLAWAASQQ